MRIIDFLKKIFCCKKQNVNKIIIKENELYQFENRQPSVEELKYGFTYVLIK